MYGSYASTILALRAKSSFFYAHPSLSRRRTQSSCCSCCCCCCSSHSSISSCESSTGFPLYGVSVSPSFVYGYYLPLPSLIHRATPSRRLRRVSCGSDGRFLEMIGLLAEAKVCFREFDREESLYSESNWDKEVEVEKSCNGDQKNLLSRNGDRRKSLRKESNAGRKRNGSSSDYRSETSVGWSADSEVKEGRCRRINGESSSNYWNRVDQVEKEVREVKKYEDNAWSRREELDSRKKSESRERNNNVRALSSSKVHKWKVRDREEEEEDDLLVDLERGVRAEYVRGDQRVIEQSESRGGSQKVKRMAKLCEDDGERVYRRMDSARDAREGYRGEEQRAVGQQVLRDGSRQVMRISEVHKDDIERPFRSTDSTHEVREEYVRGQKGVVGQRGSREEESQRVVRIAEIHEDDQKRDSRSMDSTHKSREEYVREERHDIGQRESRAESWRTSRISEMREDHTEQASTIRTVADSRVVGKDASPTSAVRQHGHVDQQVVGHTRSDRSSQNLMDISEIHDSNIERASCSQRHFEETRMKGSEDVSSSIQITKDQKTRINIQEMEKIDLNRQHEYNVDITTANVSDTGKASSSWSHGDTTVGDHEGYTTTSSVNLVCGMREQQNQTSEQVVQQSHSKKESGRTTNLSQIARSNTKRISDSQETSITRIENRNENSSLVFSHDRSKETRTVTGESSQSSKTQTAYSASLSDSSQSSKTQTAHSASISDNPSSIHINISELDDEINRDDIYPGKDDVMESASRLDKSSAHYVEEFVNKLEQQLLASDTLDNTVKQYSEAQMEETQRQTTQLSTELLGGLDVTTKNKDKKLIQESARQSSCRSGPKGTYDEMGDVRGFSSEESSCRTKTEEDALPGEMVNSNASDRTESAITRRAHRSLWTYIADIIRKGWCPNAETQHSTLKSGTRSSSNESISSEAWFSGHEADENEDEMLKKGSNGTLKEPVLDNKPANYSPVSIQKGSEAPGLGYKVSLLEAGTSTSSGSMRRGPAGGSSQLEHLSWIQRESGKQGAPLAATVIQSSSLTSVPASATVEEAITEIQRHRSESAKLGDELIGEKLPEYVGTEEKDGELKRRKLQRNKQVLKERFDEWEEAYMHENEQRKVDESFMREALLEAKKAADVWEVPVGAVLVQNGKIIARGCNLVEELRDSTAHAEMICIREASNVLRTWRLAETTLYVTLEPCPMCAGAILQARIDTVVWGAPNKLLGADGSWVRLFPGDGGSNGLDPSNQAGPVHPFHPNITLRRGILATECADVMQQFFQLRRKKIKKPEPSPPSCLPISTYPTKLLTKMHNIFCMMFCL